MPIITTDDIGDLRLRVAELLEAISGLASGALKGVKGDDGDDGDPGITDVVTRSTNGLVPAPGGSGTTRFFREDLTFAVPPAFADGNKGDATVSSSGTVFTLNSGVVSNAKLATMATKTIKGNVTGGTAAPTDLSMAAVAAELPLFTSSARGLVPPGSTGTSRFLREDGAFADPHAGDVPALQQKVAVVGYIYPTGSPQSTEWGQVETRGGSIIGFAVINPNNGPGYGTAFDLGGSTNVAYANRIATLQAAGVKVLHYLSLNYRDEAGAHTGDVYAGTVGKLYRFTAVAGTDIITTTADGTQTSGGAAGSATAHGFTTGMGPFQVKAWNSGTNTSTLPGGLAASTNYYVRVINSTTFYFYDSAAHANAGGATGLIDVTSAGSGGFYIGLSKSYANIANVYGEIDLVLTRFPTIDGFFFDEARLDGSGNVVNFCTGVYGHIKGIDSDLVCCWNGMSATNDVIDVGDVFADENTVAALEGGYGTYSYMQNYPASKFWLLGHTGVSGDIAAFVAYGRANNYGLISMNDSSFGNIPSFWESFVDQVEAGNAGPVTVEKPFGAIVLTGGTHADNSTTAKLNATSSAGETLSLFTATTNRLTYNGTQVRSFLVSFDVTWKMAANAAGVDVTLRPYRSGASLSNVKVSKTIPASDVGFQTLGMRYVMTLAPGQYVEIWATTNTSEDLTIFSGTLAITPAN